MNRQRLERALWEPLDSHWDSDAIGRFVFGPPTVAHLAAGLVVGVLLALLYVVAG